MKEVSSRAKNISPSTTLAITAKIKSLRAKGEDVVNFAAGEPDLPTPDFVCEAGIEAIRKGLTRYTPASGMAELKQAVVERFERVNGLRYRPEQVLISCGAKHSIYNILQVLVDPGDEVVIPSPYWVSYPEMVKLAGGVPLFVETRREDGFCLDPSTLADTLKEHPKAKVLILNYPSNPTGAIYDAQRLEEISKLCKDYDLWVINDEIYDVLTFEGEHTSFATLSEDAYARTITVNGVSKAYSMTGWRIGFCAGDESVIKMAGALQSHSTSNPTSISQYASIVALREGADWERKMKETYKRRAELIKELFAGIETADLFPPKGTFYAFVDISGTGLDSMTFAQRLLDEAKVGVIPGSAFGAEGWVRVSFATSEEEIRKGLERWKDWEKTLK